MGEILREEEKGRGMAEDGGKGKKEEEEKKEDETVRVRVPSPKPKKSVEASRVSVDAPVKSLDGSEGRRMSGAVAGSLSAGAAWGCCYWDEQRGRGPYQSQRISFEQIGRRTVSDTCLIDRAVQGAGDPHSREFIIRLQNSLFPEQPWNSDPMNEPKEKGGWHFKSPERWWVDICGIKEVMKG
ncbi:hypothetical protein C0995_015422 [Termitomyces sp. Mi166|nr:hypothetical protein C0995_015422 [Termitomyces sp. Mi166\